MGCGILYRMVAERIGLSATLATRRTDTLEWMLIKRSEESMVYGSFVSVKWNLL